jgi:peptide/nickel transport system permease protein
MTASEVPHVPGGAARISEGYWRLVWRQFKKRKIALVALAMLGVLGIIALFAPFLAHDVPIYVVKDGKAFWFPNIINYKEIVLFDFLNWKPQAGDYGIWPPVPYSPERSDLYNSFGKPDAKHLLGTDDRGRDVLSRMIWGTRISMSIGFVATGIAILIGIAFGSLAGYYGGRVDAVILRVIEIVLCFPSLILILTVVGFASPSIFNIMVVLGVTGWTGSARLVRGEFLKLREAEFTDAARALGLRDSRIIFRHLLPNALSPVLVAATFGVGGAILTESALSFLGLGVPAPTASWGEILDQSRHYMGRGVWWLVVYPGLAISITVISFNLVGDGLRDAMDPKLRQ